MATLRTPCHPRQWAVLLALWLLFPEGGQAQTPEYLLNQTARAIARIGLVEPVCGPFYLLDRKMIAAMERAFLQDGIERFGEAPVRRTVASARNEISSQARNIGAARWCPEQRQFYRAPGVPEFIGQPLQ